MIHRGKTGDQQGDMPSNPTWQVKRPNKRTNAASYIRMGLVLVVASTLGATMTFLYSSYLSGAPEKGKTSAQRMMEGIEVPEHGQAAVNALLDGAGDQRALRDGKVAYTPRRKRLIVLSDGEGKWNTGVWPGWGYDPESITLNWAAAGVVVQKMCPTQCEFTREQSRAAEADAVVMELVNHPKFGISERVPIPWPAKRDNPKSLAAGAKPTTIPSKLPLTVLFYYEAAQSYPKYTMLSADVMGHVDVSMTPSQASTLPISMVCPWGKTTYDFLRPPPAKQPGRLLAYFNEHGVAAEYSATIDRLFELAGDKLHSYVHKRNRPMPREAGGDPYQLSTRLSFVGTFKFVLVTESIVEEDWVEPDFSQGFLAGAVPVYIGAPNALAFSPGPRSFVHIRDFPSADALWAYLASFEDDSPETLERYKREFFSWKQPAQMTFMMDEQGQNNPIGTGHGVVLSGLMPQAALREQMQLWAPRPTAGGTQPPTFSETTAAVSKELTTAGAKPLAFDRLCEVAWRNFRRRLDQCVHYAECRLCELTTLLTT